LLTVLIARQVSIAVEKVLSLDVDAYTFEVIYSVGFSWLEDRVFLLPEATPQEMADCPDQSKCGWCEFETGRTCEVRNINGYTNPRTGKAVGVNKCCKDLWNPLMSEGQPWDGIIWPNAMETEILHQDGPTYTDLCRANLTKAYSQFFMCTANRGKPQIGLAVAYAEVRMRGVFYIPMNFQVFPTDTQFLDMHLTTRAYTWQFNLSNISYNTNATGNYVAGGVDMPAEEKRRLGLDGNSRCPRENNSGVSYFEDLSGWSVAKQVQVLRFNADDRNCLASSSCKGRPSKFSLQRELNIMANTHDKPLSAQEQESMQRSFIVFRMTVCRRYEYYVENVLVIIFLLNIINALSLLLSPEQVEARLGSCATMVLALAALQTFVADSVPSVGYSTHGQAFVKVSNALMIAAALESVIVYHCCAKRVCLLRLLRLDPEGDLAVSEMYVWDHIFVIIYTIIYIHYVDKYFRVAMGDVALVGYIVLSVVLVLVLIFHFFRLRHDLVQLKQSNSGADEVRNGSATAGFIDIGTKEPGFQNEDSGMGDANESATSSRYRTSNRNLPNLRDSGSTPTIGNC
jgi:hypothetical protein